MSLKFSQMHEEHFSGNTNNNNHYHDDDDDDIVWYTIIIWRTFINNVFTPHGFTTTFTITS